MDPLNLPVFGLQRAKRFVLMHFERVLVILMVASLLAIHSWVDYQVAFLAFYYLPIILAGFELGRRIATLAAVLVVVLVAFLQAVVGLDGPPNGTDVWMTLVPWAGFLILTAWIVGYLAEQRRQQHEELRSAYITVLELLTFQLESAERQPRGHSSRVAARALAIGSVMGMRDDDLERLRVAALLHELQPNDPRLGLLFEQFPEGDRRVPVADSMAQALDVVAEYGRYYELAGGDWPVDHLRLRLGTKILAVADSFETLLLPAGNRPPLSVWGALEEIEHAAGSTFATGVVRALRQVVSPERSVESPVLA